MKKYYLYIVLTRTNSTISKLIQLVKNDEYTHAAISLDKELSHMYSFGRKYAYIPFIGRFNHEYMNKGLYKLCRTLPGVIMEVEVSRQQYENAAGLVDHFISNSNMYKYNYRGLFHGLFNKAACYENRFLCSEFVYYILNESGITDFRLSRNLVRPQNLLNLESEIVYRGNLKDIQYQSNDYDSNGVQIRKLSASY